MVKKLTLRILKFYFKLSLLQIIVQTNIYKMKKLLFAIAALLIVGTLHAQEMRVTVTNPTADERSFESIEINAQTIKKRLNLHSGEHVIVTTPSGEIPSQWITKGAKEPISLLFQISLKGKEKVVLTISKGEPKAVEPMAMAQIYPKRFDDLVWENDLIAFRVYGFALIEKDGPSNGFDIYFKHPGSKLAVDKAMNDYFDKGISYHNDNGKVYDPYKVARTLGGGAPAPYLNGKLVLGQNFTRHEILDNGPLRATLRVSYDILVVGEQPVTETRTISIDAHSYMSQVIVEYKGMKKNSEVALGIVKRSKAGDRAILEAAKGYAIYCEPTTEADGTMRLVVATTSALKEAKVAEGHILGIAPYQAAPLTYYVGCGWSKNGFPTDSSFSDYVESFLTIQKTPAKVAIK